MKKITIHIADDHNLIREGFAAIFKRESSIEVVGESTNGNELLDWLNINSTDIILLDIKMPGLNGIEVLKELQSKNSYQKVIVVSQYDTLSFFRDSMELGARGFLYKNEAAEFILEAIFKVDQGDIYITDNFKKRFINQSISFNNIDVLLDDEILFKLLSDKEIEVLKLIATGKNAKEIGAELNLSDNTVKTHNRRIREKLQLKSSIGIFKLAFLKRMIG